MTIAKEIVSEIRQARQNLFQEVEGVTSRRWNHLHTSLADSLIDQFFRSLVPDAERSEIALVATGGYGRKEVAPYSDLDIAFVPLRENDPEIEAQVRMLFRAIVDAFTALDWPVGYAYRLRSDLPALDSTSRSSLIDGRLICGSEKAWSGLQEHFWATFPKAEFLIDKFAERAGFHQKWHNTVHIAEPHLRDCVGGLRDFQTALWVSAAIDRPISSPPTESHEAILMIRNALHLSTSRRQDQLVRSRKEQVARLLTISTAELSTMVYDALETIAQFYRDAEFDARHSEIPLAPAVFAVGGDCKIERSATLSNAALGVARATKLGLRILPCENLREADDLPRITQLITESEPTLRGLQKAGLLHDILPEMRACFQNSPSDSVHTFTIGEHSLRLIGNLDASKGDEQFADVWNDVHNSRPLYLAGLLHDVGKADNDRPHEIVGAEVARAVCERLELSSDETDAVEWLIRKHLLMAQTARTHDISHPRTAVEFARACEKPERMAMLYLLTYADTAAVSDKAWTPHTASSLAELYSKARSLIETPPKLLDPAQYRSQGVSRLKAAGRQNQDVEALLQSMPTHYLLSTPVELFADHAELVKRAQDGEISVVFQRRLDTHQTEMTVCMHDLPEPGLLSRILGILYAHDLNLHSIRVASTVGERPIALDVFTISYQGRIAPSGLCAILTSDVKTKTISADATSSLMIALGKEPERKQSMFTYAFHEGTPAVLEIETPPGRGMPYRVAKMLADFGWNVEVARIGQWAGRAVARFYLYLPDGTDLTAKQVELALAGANR